ncbi:MAG: Rne/Rng family ribonuclease [Planctomycetes bacterium]|nr:Rne/Rng family ribonuclease [Planctomycetota bacterium]
MSNPSQHMIVNYVPDEECRIAILESGRLEEFYAERVESPDGAGHVGNIYLGKVVNVESSIQAAFIDFGIGRNGFLHISDLHPRYFASSDREEKETVGHKTPHRHRPPIQSCLSRGQEIMVQVLKEGIGSKGPTLTSYLSIPGRYLVLMPHMERSGVSRKVEDIEERRSLRDAMDSLELPEGFGFIVRTAAYGRPKTELKRDLSYLQRLWKAITKKQSAQKAPCELYAESDLLIRTIRDVMSPDVKRIVIDDEGALKRVDEFLGVVAPRRRSASIEAFDRSVPIFHYFGIEEQIRQIHARTVPLPSGGSLVIDSTEAMVTIDVNSGRMRQSHDAETTAYRANLEAVDEITRQLRLRDLGGLVVLDLIDMRSRNHQRDVENQLRAKLKRDRAKTEFLRISRFGILEMTRQRMRPSLNRSYFIECPACQGRGHVKNADTTAVESMRELAYLLHHPKVARAEMVVADSVAATILSRFRRPLTTLEDATGTTVLIRISKAIATDRVDFYIYDDANADLDIDRLEHQNAGTASKKAPTKSTSGTGTSASSGRRSDRTRQDTPSKQQSDARDTDDTQDEKAESSGKGRRRRGRRKSSARKAAESQAEGSVETVAEEATPVAIDDREQADTTSQPKKRKTRRKRRSRKAASGAAGDPESAAEQTTAEAVSDGTSDPTQDGAREPDDQEQEPVKKKKRTRRRSKRTTTKSKAQGADAESQQEGDTAATSDDQITTEQPKEAAQSGSEPESKSTSKKKSRSRRSRKKTSGSSDAQSDGTAGSKSADRKSAPEAGASSPASPPASESKTAGEQTVVVTGNGTGTKKKSGRSLYGSQRRRRTHGA